jgi:DNA-binding NarL/FixJ family response regulator
MAQKTLSVKVFGETWTNGRSMPLFKGVSAEERAYIDSARCALTSPPHARLTRRELEVLLLVAAGLSNAQIADRLVITSATVISYLNCIYKKLGVCSRTAAMRYAIDHHLC